ncbi:MAG: hypothetical protein FK733_00805 [Asgard group archaeon]|nr:hypothetical protein [Asgard group archaeon]
MFAKRSQNIIDKFNSEDILRISKGANFFGQESIGSRQIRGNGVLILTSDELYFEMWVPKNRICRIQIRDILKIETTKWHLKKTKSRMLLKVVFTNKQGETDSGAWLVSDLNQWVYTLQGMIDRK